MHAYVTRKDVPFCATGVFRFFGSGSCNDACCSGKDKSGAGNEASGKEVSGVDCDGFGKSSERRQIRQIMKSCYQ